MNQIVSLSSEATIMLLPHIIESIMCSSTSMTLFGIYNRSEMIAADGSIQFSFFRMKKCFNTVGMEHVVNSPWQGIETKHI